MRNKQKGYTMIEVIIVIAIMAVIFGIVFNDYRNNSSQFALQRAAYKLLGDIRKAQSMAGIENTGCSHIDYKYGYGIDFDIIARKTSYILFADCNGNNNHNSGTDIEDVVQIEKGVEISQLRVGASRNKVDLVFLPPDPFTLVNGVRDSNTPFEITIRLESDHSKTKIISINRLGMVSIK